MKTTSMRNAAAGFFAAFCLTGTAAAGDFIGVEPLFKSGKLMVPKVNFNDTGSDGFPDNMKFSFKVYKPGTKTLIRSTKVRTYKFPQPVCVVSEWQDGHFDVKFTGINSAKRVHMAGVIYSECEEAGTAELKEDHRAVLYSGNVSTGSSWARSWAGYNLAGMNHVDWDNDGTNEMMVVLADDRGTHENIRVVFVNPANGTIESEVNYPKQIIHNY